MHELHAVTNAKDLSELAGGVDQASSLLDAHEVGIASQGCSDAELSGAGADVEHPANAELREPLRRAHSDGHGCPVLVRHGLKIGQQEPIKDTIARTPPGPNCMSHPSRGRSSNGEHGSVILVPRRVAQFRGESHAVTNQAAQKNSVIVTFRST